MPLETQFLDYVSQALIITLKVSAPILFAGVIIGLIIAIVQSVTQIQEQTLTLVPKLFIMVIVALVLLSWIIARIADFTVDMFQLTG